MSVTVLKVGGSVLTGPGAYERVAAWIAERLQQVPGQRLVIVVSAQNGVTDALLAEARALAPQPDAGALDLLWSTGELRSVALVVLALEGAGIRAIALNAHQAGVVIRHGAIASDVGVLRAALRRERVVVVPGFVGCDETGRLVTLGRGGSDLTAVVLARALRAPCELVKDVPGYFTRDPRRDAGAAHLPALTYREALARADDGCALIQRGAIEAAAEAGVRLTIRSLDEHAKTSVVGPSRN